MREGTTQVNSFSSCNSTVSVKVYDGTISIKWVRSDGN